MAKITKHICDRCGKPIKYRGWTAFIFKPQKSKYGKFSTAIIADMRTRIMTSNFAKNAQEH